jgi:hypothetical protein
MSDAASFPHEWNPLSRTCIKCGCTSTDWQNGRAATCGNIAALPQSKPQVNEFAEIKRRMAEIAKEEGHDDI